MALWYLVPCFPSWFVSSDSFLGQSILPCHPLPFSAKTHVDLSLMNGYFSYSELAADPSIVSARPPCSQPWALPQSLYWIFLLVLTALVPSRVLLLLPPPVYLLLPRAQLAAVAHPQHPTLCYLQSLSPELGVLQDE